MRRAAIALGSALAVALAVALVAGMALRDEPAPRAAAAAAPDPVPSGVSPAAAPLLEARHSATAAPASSVAPAAPPLVASAVADARVPPIDPPGAEPAPAQPWEIADPALYKAREKRLAQETAERFVQAADARLPPLLAAVDELRARNAAPADIARAEDKIRHLQAVRDALVRGEPLVQGPEPGASAP